MSSQEEIVKSKQIKTKKSKSLKTDDITEPEIVQDKPEVIEDKPEVTQDESNDLDNLSQEELEISNESVDIEYQNDEFINQITIAEEALEKASKLIKSINMTNNDFFNNAISIKKKANKSIIKINDSFTDFCEKKTSAQNKKDNKSNKNKKTKSTDKSKSSVNILKDTYPEVCLFMGEPEGTKISQSLILKKIIGVVKQYIIAGNKEISVEGDNRQFNIIGDLIPIFTFFRDQMIKRGDLDENEKQNFPKVSSYNGLMKYFKYCFHPKEK